MKRNGPKKDGETKEIKTSKASSPIKKEKKLTIKKWGDERDKKPSKHLRQDKFRSRKSTLTEIQRNTETQTEKKERPSRHLHREKGDLSAKGFQR